MMGHLIVSDLKNGIWKRFFYFIPAVLFGVYAAVSVCLVELGQPDAFGSATFLCAVFEAFQGMKILSFIEELHLTPPFFLLLHSWLILTVSFYSYYDMKERGVVVFTRCRNKNSWWFAKCVWLFFTVLLYYGMIWLACFLVTAIAGKAFWVMPEGWWSGYFLSLKPTPAFGGIALSFFVLPFATSAALAMVQMFLSVWLKPIVGILAHLIILFASLGICSQWLPGNYLMLRRMELFTEGGIRVLPALAVDLFLLLAGVIGGTVVLKKKDIY